MKSLLFLSLLTSLFISTHSVRYIITFDPEVDNSDVDVMSMLSVENIVNIEIGDYKAIIVDSEMSVEEIATIPYIKSVVEDHDDDVTIRGQFRNDGIFDTDQQPIMTVPKRNWLKTVIPESTYSWGIDRIDQKSLPLDNKYIPVYDGSDVDVYVLDTGIYRQNVEFDALRVGQGADFTGKGSTDDGHGHGTHCSGTIAGNTLGVSHKATIVPVKVLSDAGSGSTSGVIQGIQYVVNRFKQSGRCSVISMSLGGAKNDALNSAVNAAVDQGVIVVVAAGNSNRDACLESPSSASKAVVVGATSSDDSRSYFSNYGTCVSIFAPGSSIVSAGISSPTSVTTMSGTSMATPHVSGIFAQLLQKNGCTDIQQSIAEIKQISAGSILTNVPPNTPNLLVQIPKDLSQPTPKPTTTNPPRPSKRKPTARPTKKETIPSCDSELSCYYRCSFRIFRNTCLAVSGCKCKWYAVAAKCRNN